MILHRLVVESWRNLLEEVTVGPFSEGINVIHAPNGTGKSTLFEALQRAIFDAHNVTGQAIEAIKPWGRDLVPRVMAEFSHGQATYRLSKQFLGRPSVRLERKEGETFRPFKEGKAANEFVRGLFSDQSPGRGLSKPEHHGLCQVLWAPQGGLELAGLAGGLVADVKEALGLQVAGTLGGPIEEEIRRRYFSVFTKTGRLKTGRNAPESVRIEEELEALRQRRMELVGRYKDFQEAGRRVEDLRAEREQAAREVRSLREGLEEARARLEAYRALMGELKEAKGEAETAEARYKALEGKTRQVREARREIGRIDEEIEQLRRDAAAARKTVAARKRDLAASRSHLEDLERRGREIDRLGERLEAARRLVEGGRRLALLRKRLEEVEGCRRELEEARRSRARTVAPDRETLRAVREVLRDRDDARTRVESSLIRLEVVPGEAMEMELIRGEDAGPRKARAGEPIEVRGAPEVVLDLAGTARLRAWGPVGDVERQRELLAEADRRLAELTRPYGTTDPERLQAMLDAAEEADRAVERLEERLGDLLEGRSPEGLLTEIAEEEAARREVVERFPEWREATPDVDRLRREWEQAKGAHATEVAEARGALEAAQEGLRGAESELGKIETRLEEKASARRRVAERLGELVADGKSDEQRAEELDKLALQWRAARKPIEGIEDRLREFSGDPAAEVETLARKLEAAEKVEREARDKEKTAEGEVARLAGEGLYAQLAGCEERIAALERRLVLERRRIEALRLLHETVEELRAGMTARVVEPLERVASGLLERITGPRVGGVRLGEDLAPAFVHPAEAPGPVSIGNLSGGETEQLHLVCRLALAEVLAREERQLLVLDDVLTATDTGRFDRILRVLEEMRHRLQVVILTCHPERYGTLEEARFFDLEALKRGATPAAPSP